MNSKPVIYVIVTKPTAGNPQNQYLYYIYYL